MESPICTEWLVLVGEDTKITNYKQPLHGAFSVRPHRTSTASNLKKQQVHMNNWHNYYGYGWINGLIQLVYKMVQESSSQWSKASLTCLRNLFKLLLKTPLSKCSYCDF